MAQGKESEGAAAGKASWHALEAGAVLEQLAVSEHGLDEQEVRRRRERFGTNELPRQKRESPLTLLWRQLKNPLLVVLLAAAAVALVMGKHTDALVVLAVVVINTLIGFVQELRASKAIEALSQMVPEHATVLRNGKKVSVRAQELVPGDVVLIASGDRVPADMRLLALRNLQVEEAALTGESVPVAKRVEAASAEAAIGDRLGMVYGGTVVTSGTGTAVVVQTGEHTELGRISHLVQEAVELETPLTKQLKVVGRYITLAILVVSTLLLPLALWRGYPLVEAMLVAITLAVAAIPEGLPAIVTIALAIGVRRMAARKAIVRSLPAVETLGSTTVICTDKTGTLTRNEMTVQALWTPESGTVTVSGIGYAPEGELRREDERLEELPPEVRLLLLAGVLCNDATLRRDGESGWKLAGDPTEGALAVVAEKAGLQVDALRKQHPRIDVIPFESEHQYMATVHDLEEQRVLLIKGAPEVVLRHCDGDSERVLEEVERLAARGMRVLAAACKPLAPDETEVAQDDVREGGFRLLGLQGMIDPPRDEAIEAVRACHRAGVAVKMMTGDHRLTAQAIGAELGLGNGPAVTGAELERWDEGQLDEVVTKVNVFARVAPEHKLKLVRALQRKGHIAAMTGDGVNDAPSLKQSNIGVAMGITGTAVAKQAADIVLADDNFASVEAAVEEGRRVYDNLIKSFAFVLPTNVGLALILMVAVALFPVLTVDGALVPLMPMLPRQILWINLVASITLSLPLALEVAEPEVMRRPPRPPDEPIFSGFLVGRTIAVALLMAAGAVGLFLWEYTTESPRKGHALALAEAQTMAVTTITMFQIFYLVTCRSLRGSVFRIGFFSNRYIFVGIGTIIALQLAFIYLPFMQRLFGTAPLSPAALGLSVLAGTIILPVIAAEKWWRNRRGRPTPPVETPVGRRALRTA